MPRVIFHVDMDAFFASIEQRDHPEYRGQPLVVGAPPDRRGVVAAASYEARAFGVRSAMPSRTAGRLCPQAIFVRPRMEAYRAESAEVMAILRTATPLVERVSVDEAYLDVSTHYSAIDEADAALDAASALGRAIKERIATERRLTASVGLGPNKFLAKLASDYDKPDGLTVIRESEKVAFLRPLPVRAIPGVGPVTAEALAAQGIRTIGDLQTTTLDLTPVVGSFAARLKACAWGEDDRELDLSEERKSISAENTFASDTEDRPTLRATLHELAGDVAQTLDRHGLGARTVQVKVRYGDFTTLTRQLRLEDPVRGAAEIYRLGCFLLARHRLVKRPLRLLGLGVSTLAPWHQRQLHLALPL
jgi:DNA polymerase-4